MTMDVCGLLLDELPDAFVVQSPEGIVRHWSRSAEAIFGYPADEVVGRDLLELIVPADCADEERGLRRDVLEAGAAAIESLRRRKDHSLVYVSISAKLVRDGQGRPQYVILCAKDVTQLKVMRDAKLVEARYGKLLESMPDGIVLVNASGRIVFANSQAEAMFGYEGGRLLGRPVEALLPERLRGAHVAHRSGYFGQMRTRAMGMGLELYGLRQDGTEFPVEIGLSPLGTEEGTLVTSAIRDITERKRFERALHEKNVELAKANAAKDRFLASMSHELRTPLNAIIGFTGTLLMQLPGPLNEVQEKQLRRVKSSGQHLLELINDLLDIAKIEAGKIELNVEPVDCRAVIEEIVATLRPQAEGKGLAFAVEEVADDPLQLLTDRRALSQIVINLVQNAIKFTERGSVTLRLARRKENGRPLVVVSVCDTGIGIGEEDCQRLFAPFSRIMPRSGKFAEGTGLGLHLSQKLAERMGGQIVVESAPGSGSTFSLVLPEG
ncbi:PAS domain-containing hybrid sensor histidine kinase/response regulator [Azoarcus sp. DN11]|uniref:PAS domain-containing hybrid sensor histidine kinase/response regulator n=1 Tax=Azoarcus sp. DN11 TaxID=356837 RepID=UPI000EB4340E|nr:PAS domain-containing hybrid sensor histidine kinase/response regulator [Azoarcus sp. DN11]AYH44620.1 PAS domain-containing sensor histidine kinase [Azoarcus sp. DN11]